jgi:hypothetical protein
MERTQGEPENLVGLIDGLLAMDHQDLARGPARVRSPVDWL